MSRDDIIDTGKGGASLFEFLYQPDELGRHKPPLRYGRCEIALSDEIAEGTITRVTEVTDDDGEFVGWMLLIATSTDLSKYATNNLDIAVRLLT